MYLVYDSHNNRPIAYWWFTYCELVLSDYSNLFEGRGMTIWGGETLTRGGETAFRLNLTTGRFSRPFLPIPPTPSLSVWTADNVKQNILLLPKHSGFRSSGLPCCSCPYLEQSIPTCHVRTLCVCFPRSPQVKALLFRRSLPWLLP